MGDIQLLKGSASNNDVMKTDLAKKIGPIFVLYRLIVCHKDHPAHFYNFIRS